MGSAHYIIEVYEDGTRDLILDSEQREDKAPMVFQSYEEARDWAHDQTAAWAYPSKAGHGNIRAYLIVALCDVVTVDEILEHR